MEPRLRRSRRSNGVDISAVSDIEAVAWTAATGTATAVGRDSSSSKCGPCSSTNDSAVENGVVEDDIFIASFKLPSCRVRFWMPLSMLL